MKVKISVNKAAESIILIDAIHFNFKCDVK